MAVRIARCRAVIRSPSAIGTTSVSVYPPRQTPPIPPTPPVRYLRSEELTVRHEPNQPHRGVIRLSIHTHQAGFQGALAIASIPAGVALVLSCCVYRNCRLSVRI